jgi:hypothetical protein
MISPSHYMPQRRFQLQNAICGFTAVATFPFCWENASVRTAQPLHEIIAHVRISRYF